MEMKDYLVVLVGVNECTEIEEVENVRVISTEESEVERIVSVNIDELKLNNKLSWIIQSVQDINEIKIISNMKEKKKV